MVNLGCMRLCSVYSFEIKALLNSENGGGGGGGGGYRFC